MVAMTTDILLHFPKTNHKGSQETEGSQTTNENEEHSKTLNVILGNIINAKLSKQSEDARESKENVVLASKLRDFHFDFLFFS
jgi:hypothetical protein